MIFTNLAMLSWVLNQLDLTAEGDSQDRFKRVVTMVINLLLHGIVC
jgi:hypothetical protein